MCNYNKQITAFIIFFSSTLVSCTAMDSGREKLADVHGQIALQQSNRNTYRISSSVFEETQVSLLTHQQPMEEPEQVNVSQLQLISTVPTCSLMEDTSLVGKAIVNCKQGNQVAFIAKGGHYIQFMDDSCEEAIVAENLAQPFSRTLSLPVRKEDPNLKLQDLIVHSTQWQQDHIQVYFPEQDPKNKGGVYIGTCNRGLLGGMLRGILIHATPLIADEALDTFSEFGYECRRLLNNLQELYGQADEINCNLEFSESIRQIKAEHEALLNQMRETSRQAAINRKSREEKEKEAAEKFQKLVERMQENIKKQREIEEKRGKPFVSGAEESKVDMIGTYLKSLNNTFQKIPTHQDLPSEFRQKIKLVYIQINKEIELLQEAHKNISYNINHPDKECHRDYDEEHRKLAQEFLVKVYNYKIELNKLLVARGEKLSDYDPKATQEEKTERESFFPA